MARVLHLFLRDTARAWYGCELSQASGHPGGSIYPVLRRLRELGWLDETHAGPGRRTFRLTREGAAEAFGVLLGLAQTYAPPGAEVRQVAHG